MRRRVATLVLLIAGAAQAGQPVVVSDFALKALDGRNYRLSEYRGEVVAVVFWASWCGECLDELSRLQSLRELYGDAGLQVLAVSMDERTDAAASVAASLELTYPQLHDADLAVSKVWDPRRLPATYLFDRAGELRYLQLGSDAQSRIDLVDRVRALLDE
jgi:peroxiredoxin